ncbi:hypothetical protein Lalb_Chr12g0200081 [Lupinus albus]|uniref:Uncharacterized protein n=1 Tax=Lupinus albus TaxID=3870 RepID=A0A6A4PM28_LUPAL|nr:hypothetical protein Lalb_Chr12g0200081 [Lupinus albus]
MLLLYCHRGSLLAEAVAASSREVCSDNYSITEREIVFWLWYPSTAIIRSSEPLLVFQCAEDSVAVVPEINTLTLLLQSHPSSLCFFFLLFCYSCFVMNGRNGFSYLQVDESMWKF